ncbi:hypothetical protein [Microviridae sp.]|nr:hypothetical protein [Microviridae sp.]
MITTPRRLTRSISSLPPMRRSSSPRHRSRSRPGSPQAEGRRRPLQNSPNRL